MITKILKPKNFDYFLIFIAPICFVAMVIFIILSAIAITNSPPDYQQSNAVKIMYIHVPCAWMALLIYCLVAFFNLAAFIWKNPFFHLIAKNIAKTGCFFAFLTLATGSIWGKPIWGTWWVWDARLTSMLILFFLYLGYLMIFLTISNQEQAEKISAMVAIIGLVNIPIIKFSVEYWNSLHQKSSILRSGGNAIHSSMLPPLFYCFSACFCYFLVVAIFSIATDLKSRKAKNYRNL